MPYGASPKDYLCWHDLHVCSHTQQQAASLNLTAADATIQAQQTQRSEGSHFSFAWDVTASVQRVRQKLLTEHA